ncbi:MAG: prephenate dehydrogenase/arogenate dehydrogenase family protein [Chloroflexota bacterium]
MQAQNITFFGLTQASLSIALAIKQGAPALNLIGYDDDSKLGKRAAEAGMLDEVANDPEEAISKSDILLIDLPQAETENLFNLLGGLLQEHVVYTHLTPRSKHYQKLADTVVAKGFYVNAAPVPSVKPADPTDSDDPISTADVDMFRNSLICLMPSAKVDEAAVTTIRGIGQLIGADPYLIDPAEYDVYMLALKTLPQLSSLALFESLYGQTAWKDLQRMAGQEFVSNTAAFSNQGEAIAKDVFNDPATATHWINQMIASLQEIKRWIEISDQETLASLVSEKSFNRDVWLQVRKDNQWDETPKHDVENEGLRDMFMGNMFGRRRRE